MPDRAGNSAEKTDAESEAKQARGVNGWSADNTTFNITGGKRARM